MGRDLIYIKFLIVRSLDSSFVSSFVSPSVTFFTTTSNMNNSVIFHHRTVPRVANERYCYIFFIFRVFWGEGVKGGPLGGTKKKRKTDFFLITHLWVVTERSQRSH